MDTSQRKDSKEETLNDSWVELHFQQQQQLLQQQSHSTNSTPPLHWTQSQTQSQTSTPPLLRSHSGTPPLESSFSKPLSVYNGAMEKLLLEAQRESRGSSRMSSVPNSMKGSPKSPHSPNNELSTSIAIGEIPTIQEGQVVNMVQQELNSGDWIWDWSSRPEANPPCSCDQSGKFKHPPRHKLSVRNTRVMQSGPFSLENLPMLLFSHACTFFLGAAAMFIYFKKYCSFNVISAAATLD